MKETVDVVGIIKFDDINLDVYSSLDEPLFKASDVANILEYGVGNTWNMLELCDEVDKVKLPSWDGKQYRQTTFVTMTGMLDMLSQSRRPAAKQIRKFFVNSLIETRKSCGFNIVEMFERFNKNFE